MEHLRGRHVNTKEERADLFDVEARLNQLVRDGLLPVEAVIDAIDQINRGVLVTAYGHPYNGVTSGPFNHPQSIAQKVRQWNRRFGWGFDDELLARTGNEFPFDKLRLDRELPCMIALVPYLPGEDGSADMVHTFNELLRAVGRQQAGEPDLDWCAGDDSQTRSLKGSAHKPGLFWEVLSYRTVPGLPPADDSHLASAGVLAAAAEHPEWLRQTGMFGSEYPLVTVPGYTVDNYGEEGMPFPVSPAFERDVGNLYRIRLSKRGGNRSHHVPVVLASAPVT